MASFFGGNFFGGSFFKTETPPAQAGGGAGGSARSVNLRFGWEKWRKVAEKRFAKRREAAEKRVTRLEVQVKELRFAIANTLELEALKKLMAELEAIQIRLDRALAVLDDLEMQEVLLVYHLMR